MADILFVDDAEDVHLLMRRYLRRAQRDDIALVAARNGLEALELLAERTFILVLSDVNMPFLDGPGLIDEMRARGDETPVALVGGLMLEEHEGVLAQVQKNVLLADPFTIIDRLLASI